MILELLDYNEKNNAEKALAKADGWFDKVTFTLSNLPPIQPKPGTLWYHKGRAFIKKGQFWTKQDIEQSDLEEFIQKVKNLGPNNTWQGKTFDLSAKGKFCYHIENRKIVIVRQH